MKLILNGYHVFFKKACNCKVLMFAQSIEIMFVRLLNNRAFNLYKWFFSSKNNNKLQNLKNTQYHKQLMQNKIKRKNKT